MKKSKLIYLIYLSIFCFASCSQPAPEKKSSDSDLDDIVEYPPEKKVNQAPTPTSNETKKTNSGIQETVGTFSLIEEGDYYRLFMKDENKKDVSFYFWEAYEGADQLNTGNWKSKKGKKIKVTWENSKEKDPDSGKEFSIKKILAIEVL